MIDPVISGFITSVDRIHFDICDNLIITFGKICFCLRFLNTYCVESLDRFWKVVTEKVNNKKKSKRRISSQ